MTVTTAATGGSAGRITAMVLRYWFLLRSSWPRLVELAYWPTVQMVIWGLISVHLADDSSYVARAFGVLLAAVLLWDVVFRAQLGLSVPFLEEVWSRNLGQLFASPLRPFEWILSLAVISLLRTLIGVLPAALLAIPLYGYSVFEMGPALLAFFALLMLCGWAMALVAIALILHYGLGAEGLAWGLVFLVAPISAVYYPVDVLPGALQVVALGLPTTHVFEGMRGVLFGTGFDSGHFVAALLLDGAYGVLGAAVFAWSFESARRRGALLQQGE